MNDFARQITMSAHHRRADLGANLALIWPLLGRHIAFHRRLVDLTASVKAALLLSQIIYWTRHGKDIAAAEGWFFKTAAQWQLETGLSLKEQFSARMVLRKLAVLDERRHGLPAKLHFRLVAGKLAGLLSARIESASGGLDWSDGAAVAELLGPALAFHRTLAGIAGGVNAGLLLSRALHITRVQSKMRPDGWIGRSMMQWMRELGLTRREQEVARRELTKIGVWEECVRGIPPRVFVRVKMRCLMTLLLAQASGKRARPTRLWEEQGGDVSFQNLVQNGETRGRESLLLESTEVPDQQRQKRHYGLSESAGTYVQRSTGNSVQPQSHDNSTAAGALDGRSADLIFPAQLLPEERVAATALVKGCGDVAQQLLDELAARLNANSVRTSPIAYLRGMVERARTGQFNPELGLQIAAARRRKHEDSLLREAREAEERRFAARRSTPEYQATLAARRGDIRLLLDTLDSAVQRKKR